MISPAAAPQYRGDVPSLNARLRFVRDGTDLWIVYNEALNTDRYSLTPVPPVSRGRAVMVKYTHTGLVETSD